MKVALLVMAFLVVAPHLNAATISPVADRAGCNRGNDRLPSVFIYDAPFTSVTGNIIRTNLPVHGIVTTAGFHNASICGFWSTATRQVYV